MRVNSAIKGLEGGGMEAEPKRRKSKIFFGIQPKKNMARAGCPKCLGLVRRSDR